MSMTDEELQAADCMQPPEITEETQPVQEVVPTEEAATSVETPVDSPTTEPKKKKPVWVWLLAAAVVCALAIGGVKYSDYSKKVNTYNEAVALLENSDYKTAISSLNTLEDFESSAELKDYGENCQAYLAAVDKMKAGDFAQAEKEFEPIEDFANSAELKDYCGNKLLYDEAISLVDEENFADAQEIFEKLGSFKDSEELKDFCGKSISYNEAAALLDKENYAEALAIFEELGSFDNSEENAETCRVMIKLNENYDSAIELYNKGSYAEAKKLFVAAEGILESESYIIDCENAVAFDEVIGLLESGSFSEAVALAVDVDTEILKNLPDYDENYREWTDYLTAVKWLEENRRYEAFKVFDLLGDFYNSPEMAESCALEIPGNKVIYRNEEYKAISLSLTIQTPNDGLYNYLKFYADNGDLMLTAFIKPNSTYNVQFPAGTFGINIGYGEGPWYGEEDMFGDNATYQRMQFGDNADRVTLRSGSYVLTLRTGKTTGSTVDTKSIGRGQM